MKTEIIIKNHGELTKTLGGQQLLEKGGDLTFEDIARLFPDRKYIAARQGNILKELSSKVFEDVKDSSHRGEGVDDEIEFIGVTHPDGEKIYQRSLSFILIRAIMSLFEDVEVKVSHSLSKGLYCLIKSGGRHLTAEDYILVEEKMREIVKSDLPINTMVVTYEEAHAIFARAGMESRLSLLKYRADTEIRLYELDGLIDYFYGYMAPSAGYIQHFGLVKYGDGVILRHPTRFVPDGLPEFVESPKIAEVFDEMSNWLKILDIPYVSNLNELILKREEKSIIQIAEALQEKKIASIADMITKQKKKIILIAGPSSSGKTTFANRLKIQLQVNGLRPITIGTDHYFVNRDKTPRDENGEFDFECLEAVDVERFNYDLTHLLDGAEISLPSFDFHKGERFYTGEKLKIDEDQPIIIEGIHGLNEKLTAQVFKKDKFKIYISALTQLNIDNHNRIPTTQARLIRRIVRDNQFRGHSAEKTISMWPSVRRGEEKNIFPYQEDADVMFNSALAYEQAVLKKHALPLLREITPESPQYQEALLLRKFLRYFESIEDDELIPNVSILKEFIGGSGFDL